MFLRTWLDSHKWTPIKFLNNPASIFLFKINNEITKTMSEIYLKLKIKTPEQSQWRYFSVFITKFEQISHIVLVFPLLTLQNAGWKWAMMKR